ncbi:E3 ubiquitin-protein ligase FANCL isoform X2 [Halyomorpha halys]|uniref:E3 ubiquitin-protein ligase FANCL isoform X2 n=1 Tax=Halyomorpha halys TaxID=286706 RepID=UPI0034D2252E
MHHFQQLEVNQFKIKIFVPAYPLMTDASFECSPYIKSCLQSHIDNLKKCKTLLSLVYCIIHIVKSKLATEASPMELWNGNTVKLSHAILMELEKSLPKENVIEIKESLKTIKLKYNDIDGNEHFLFFNVTSEYPKGNINILEVDLPLEVVGSLSKVNTIGQLYDLFKQSVDSLLPFWRMCKKLDEKSWVVEPSKPQKRDVYRRILINEYLSIVLTFNPLDLTSYPDVKFLGSMKAVAEGKKKYIRNIEVFGWKEELDVAENLTRLFEIDKLPVKESTCKAIDNENECYICFMSTIENEEPPSKWCNNPQCSSWYHHSCLVQWLQMVVSCAELSDHISGTCPYCGEKLWCQLRKDDK